MTDRPKLAPIDECIELVRLSTLVFVASQTDVIVRDLVLDAVTELAELRAKAAEADELRKEVVELLNGIVLQHGGLVADGSEFDGWHDAMALGGVNYAGSRLVELGLWEKHPGGKGRRQFYRPITADLS